MSTTRLSNVVLMLAILVGSFMLLEKRRVLSVVKAEHTRLAAKYGALPVKDRTKYLVTRIDTGDAMHFLWRCYYPAGLQVYERCIFGLGSSGSGSSHYTDESEHLHRCRFGVDEGHVNVHVMDRGGGSCLGMNDPAIAGFLNDYWNELDVEVLEGTTEMSTDQVLSFVVIRVPDPLVPQLPDRYREQYESHPGERPFFQLVYGTQQAFAAFDEQQPENSQ